MSDKPQDGNENQEQDSTEVVTPDVTTPEPDYKALAAQEQKQRQRANREAQAAKKRIESLESQLQEIADKEKSELQKAQEKLAQFEKELATERKEKAHATRVNQVLGFGVEAQYADYIAQDLAKAEESEDFSVSDWVKSLKETKPAFFGGKDGNATPPSGGGGPATKTQSNTKEKQITELEGQIAALEKATIGRRSQQVEAQLMSLRRQLGMLKKGKDKFIVGESPFFQPVGTITNTGG